MTTTDYRNLAETALSHEGFEAYFPGLTVDQARQLDLVTPLAEAMERLDVRADAEGWAAPDGLTDLAWSLLDRGDVLEEDTITVEYVAEEAHGGPTVIVHRTAGPFHVEDNPGTVAAAYDTTDGVTDHMTPAQIAAVAGFDADRLELVAEGHSDCWEVQA